MATWADVSRIVGARVADEGVKFALIADQPDAPNTLVQGLSERKV